ncbi:MAG: TolB family protein [Mariprofundaceae bacterium]
MKFALHMLWIGLVVIGLGSPTALAAPFHKAPAPLFPVQTVIADRQSDEIYPSIAGNYLVYSLRKSHQFAVARVSVDAATASGRGIVPNQPKEAVRYGVALGDGSIGYVSNRMGPISAWMRQARGDGHVAIANMATFNGGVMPMNLKASHNGRFWCFDSSMDKKRRSKVLNDFTDGYIHTELIGQSWRMYHSDSFRFKQGYNPTKSGNRNEFAPPLLFIFDRSSSQLTMIPNALNGSISPDGKRIAFAREINGNYDLWMQNMDGSNLTQLTNSSYGEFEPAWSPDGKKLAFASNRDSNGHVLHTSIYIMDISSGRSRRLTNAPKATDGGPAWKDTTTVLFHSNRSPTKPQATTVGDWNIWQVSFKGAL